jgi:pimeloyl-ACP methyl ester carboxylesterase
MTSSADAQTVTLSGGRILAYAEFGLSTAPRTTTIFYFHGFPASRLEGALWHDAALRLNARIIAPDRPGMGQSTFQTDRTLLDWPGDVLALADHLQIESFSVLGASGGAPYVLACARSLPATRLRSAAVVSGLYPVALGTRGMLLQGRVLLWLAPRMVGAVSALLDSGLGRAARNSKNPRAFDNVIMRDIRKRPEVDRRCIEHDEKFRSRFLDSIRESFKTGSRGAAWDARLLGSPWQFELGEVQCQNLTLWHGGLDINSPIDMARKAANQLKGARLEVFEEEGHVSLIANHMDEILNRL